MSEVVRLADYDKRSQNPDACGPRNPADAGQIFILPILPKPKARVLHPTVIEPPSDVAHQ